MAISPHQGAIPGTVHLVDINNNGNSRTLENGIELVPRPSNDPEDPLNWSIARKRLAAIMMLVYTLGIGLPATFHYSVLADITADTGISTNVLVEGTGYMFLLLGWGCLFWQPIAQTYGRRGVYLISMILVVPMMVWTAYTKTGGEWYAHRILLGFIISPVESLPEITIPDVFFAHERGAWMSVYVFTLFGSNFLAPLIAGWFADAFGWRWTMHFGTIIAAVSFVILFFFMEETMFVRNTLEGLENETPDQKPMAEHIQGSRTPETAEKGHKHSDGVSDAEGTFESVHISPKKSYMKRLQPFVNLPGRPSNKQMFHAMYLPLIILAQFPTIMWAGFTYGINLCWYLVMNATASPILSAPPYNFSAGEVGSIYAGPIIGAALGCIWSGIIADRLTIKLARRNNGIREPEQRLWPLALSAVLSCVGLIIWGVGADKQVHWAVLAVSLGILTFSVVTGGAIALSYNIDCFKDISGNSTTSVIIVRNTMGFAISYGIGPWYTNMGLQSCFIMAGFLSLGCTATFLLFIWKGKALRKFSANRYWKYAEKSMHHD